MHSNLQQKALAVALAAMADQPLQALCERLDDEALMVPQLRSWLKAAIAFERARRGGHAAALPLPHGAITDACNIERSLVALAVLNATSQEITGAAAFFDAAADALCSVGTAVARGDAH